MLRHGLTWPWIVLKDGSSSWCPHGYQCDRCLTLPWYGCEAAHRDIQAESLRSCEVSILLHRAHQDGKMLSGCFTSWLTSDPYFLAFAAACDQSAKIKPVGHPSTIILQPQKFMINTLFAEYDEALHRMRRSSSIVLCRTALFMHTRRLQNGR